MNTNVRVEPLDDPLRREFLQFDGLDDPIGTHDSEIRTSIEFNAMERLSASAAEATIERNTSQNDGGAVGDAGDFAADETGGAASGDVRAGSKHRGSVWEIREDSPVPSEVDGMTERPGDSDNAPQSPPRFEAALRSISRTLAAHGLVLERYRRSALLRRIRRRSNGSGVLALEAYAERLSGDAEEARELVREIIRPSGLLLRDSMLLDSLCRVIPEYFSDIAFPQLWVPDCGSGEEAYALAMALQNTLDVSGIRSDFIVYGTDTDVDAVRLARTGRFGRQMASSVPRPMRERFLLQTSLMTDPTVARELAQRCQFMVHSVGTPSPFVDLSIVLCRNLLLYLAPTLQRRVLERIHEALQPRGLLLLGARAENVGHDDLFEPHPLAPGVYVRRERAPGNAPARDAGITRGLDMYAAAFRTTGAALLLIDDTASIVEVNPTAAERLKEIDDLSPIGRSLYTLIAVQDRPRVSGALSRVAAGLSEHIDVALMTDKDITVALDFNAVARYPDRVLVTVGSCQTGLAEDTLLAPRRIDALLRAVSDGVIVANAQGQVTDMNDRAERMTGWTRLEAVGQMIDQVFRVEPGEPTLSPSRLLCFDEVTPANHGLKNLWLTHRDGRRLAIVANAPDSPELTATNQTTDIGHIITFEDVSERKMLVAELSYRSAHDQMTGLLNRETFQTRARAAHAEARRGGPSAVLCYLDVDQFKLINDTLGHFAGDELLRGLAAELRVLIGPRDSFARLGGDEFGVLLVGYDLRSARPIVDALILAARRFRFQWSGQGYAVTISIGASLINAESENVTHALSAADAACFAAKDAGRDRARFAGEDEELARRYIDMSLVGKLGRALEEGRFVLYFEDVVDVNQPEHVVYRELLVRMLEEDGKLSSPGAFIQAAERFFLMVALDRWVLHNALRGIAKLPQDDIVYAVNLSAQSLSDENFLDYVIEELEESGVDPRRICFEITETAAVSRFTEAVRFITEVSDMGCRFALDDFGAGMASFSYLKNFSVDFLKIDGSFVRSMLDNRIDHGMVESINRIGHQIGLRTIAEHVETPALLEPLRAMGVDLAQGRGLAQARPFMDLLEGL